MPLLRGSNHNQQTLKMNISKEHKVIWRFALILLLAVGVFTSCEQSTGPGDDNGPNPDTSPTAPSITSFSASDELVPAGETVTLSWEVSGDSPMTLTLEPEGTDVSGETSAEVTPEEETTYRLVAENEGGNDEAEVTVSVIADGETAAEISITGLPGSVQANVAVTDHNTLMQWVTVAGALTGLAPSTYTVAAGVVHTSSTTYLPDDNIQTISLGADEIVNIQVNYSEASGSLYETDPDVGACDEGSLTQQAKERGLMSLNFIRTLTGLPPVGYDTGSDTMVQKASLMFASNTAIDHTPPESWHCYSDEGAEGAEKSNIGITAQNSSIGSVPEDFVTLWADDVNVPSLGHRRWLIDPFLPNVAVGLVEGTPQTGEYSHTAGAAIRVVPDQDADISGLPLSFVAYPRGDFPTRLFTNDWFLSFSVLADPGARFNNQMQIDYSQTTISVEDENGSALSVTDVSSGHTPSGLPNQLKWKVSELEDNVKYTVTITGVIVNGESKDYSYTVNLK